MFLIKYDVESMVKLIRCIEKHPVLYDTNHSGYSLRFEQDTAWKNVSKEVEESESLCRDRWRSIRACFGRHLRNQNANRKPYYLAKHLDFLLPFTSVPKNPSLKTFENGSPVAVLYGGSSGDDTAVLYDTSVSYDIVAPSDTAGPSQDNRKRSYCDYDEIFDDIYIDISSDDPTIELPIKRPRALCSPMLDEVIVNGDVVNMNGDANSLMAAKDETVGGYSDTDMSMWKRIDSTDPDVVFFKSTLSEVARMSSEQKIQFKTTVLRIMNDILFINKEGDDQEDIQEPHDIQESHNVQESNDMQESHDIQDSDEIEESHEMDESQDVEESHDMDESQDLGESQDIEELDDIQEIDGIQELQELHNLQELHYIQESDDLPMLLINNDENNETAKQTNGI